MLLPVDCDFSATALQWAIELLDEAPCLLMVTLADYGDAMELFPHVAVSKSLPRYAWFVRGDTREVYSNGG